MAKGGEFVIPSDVLAPVFTRSDFSDDHKAVEELISSFVEEQILSEAATDKIEHKKDLGFTRQLLRELGNLGLLGVEIPEQYGGGGLDKVTAAIVTEWIGRQGSFACSYGAHKGIGTWPIIFFGTEEQKRKYLPKLATGELVTAYSLTEAGSGSDAGAAKTKAIPSADGTRYLLSGEKMFLTNGGFADMFIVFAKIPDIGLTAFIVEKSFPGVVIGKEEDKMGIRGSSTTVLSLDSTPVPVGNLLGEPGKGLKIALNVLNLGRFALGAGALGAAKLCLEEALAYAQERSQFGCTIVNFPLIQEKLAKMSVLILAMESIVYRTAGLLEEALGKVDHGDPKAVLKAAEEYAIECSIVKVFCSEALNVIAGHNVQIHGGSGFCEDFPAARHLRDAPINKIFEGTNEINRLVMFQMLTKKIMKGELPLIKVIGQAQAELASGRRTEEDKDLLGRLLVQLNTAKKAAILVSGAILQHYGSEMEKNQVDIGKISDCLIDLYVLDSMLSAVGKNRTPAGESALRLAYDEVLPGLRTRVGNLFASALEGEELAKTLSAVGRLLRTVPENQARLVKEIYASLQ